MPLLNHLPRTLAFATLSAATIFSSRAWGESVDCSPLDPRVSISKDYGARASASAGTLFKLAKVSGEAGAKDREVIQNLVQNAPASESNLS